mmetsp:Transcript_25476/g.71063  ORF Transcript_25476/g.71063 Transcript_25476/m.71063 type:complete len:206 (-) Transcript_25476:479-1096(-)
MCPTRTSKVSACSPSFARNASATRGGPGNWPCIGKKRRNDTSRRLSGRRPPLSTSGGSRAAARTREIRSSVDIASPRMAKVRSISAATAPKRRQGNAKACASASQRSTEHVSWSLSASRHEAVTCGQTLPLSSGSKAAAPWRLNSSSRSSHSLRTFLSGCGRTQLSKTANSGRASAATRRSDCSNLLSSPPTCCHQLIATGRIAR